MQVCAFVLSLVRFSLALVLVLTSMGCDEGRGEREDGEGFDGPVDPCSTGETSNADEGERMAPGGDCNGCHGREGEGPIYTIAGTVMGALDDAERCAGPAGVTVEITDANGQVIELTTNSVGNFTYRGELATPYTARVLRDGVINAMATPQIEGSCGSCHTETGASSAPGRITAP